MKAAGAKKQTVFLTGVNAVVRALGLLLRVMLSRLLGAEIMGIAELAHHVLGLPVRVGMPLMQSDASIGLVSPEDATVVGVLTETVRRRRLSGAEKRSDGTFSGLLAQLKRIVFGDFSG